MLKAVVAVICILAAPAALYMALGGDDPAKRSEGDDGFTIPSLSTQALDGKGFFSQACGQCHGAYGEGNDSGPTLIHTLYGKAAFPDSRIRQAVQHGAVARNWPFGDMPPVEGLSEQEIHGVIGFLREVQAANDID